MTEETIVKKIATVDATCRHLDEATGARLEGSGAFTLVYMGEYQNPGSPESYGLDQVLVYCNGKYSLVRVDDTYVGSTNYTLRECSGDELDLWHNIK